MPCSTSGAAAGLPSRSSKQAVDSRIPDPAAASANRVSCDSAPPITKWSIRARTETSPRLPGLDATDPLRAHGRDLRVLRAVVIEHRTKARRISVTVVAADHAGLLADEHHADGWGVRPLQQVARHSQSS